MERSIKSWFDILPEEINQHIWKYVNQDTLNLVVLFGSYKKMAAPLLISKTNDLNDLKVEFYSNEDIVINDNENNHITKNYLGISSLLSKEIENGETCGIFDPNIIYNSNQIYRFISNKDKWKYLGFKDFAKATFYTYTKYKLKEIVDRENKWNKPPALNTRSKVK